MLQFVEATTDEQFKMAAELFKEYAAQIKVDLSFQNFEKELIEIKEQYARPTGVLFVLHHMDKIPMGCFGIRKFEGTICELKRMYLKEALRGKGLGKTLVTKAIEAGKALQYTKMRLDTLPTMKTAISLYQKMGFYEIAAYRFNPIEGTKYFEIHLQNK